MNHAKPVIANIQILRGIAASCVVLSHAVVRGVRTFPEREQESFLATYEDLASFGHFGVDLFFVISGFVMMFVHFDDFKQHNAARVFFIKRCIRLIPIYWLLTTIAVLLLAFFPRLFTFREHLEPAWIFGSYAFIPIATADGLESPVIGLGWTLNYEMFFYSAFALGLLVSLRTGMATLTAIFCSLIMAGFVFEPSIWWLKQVTSPLLLEFLFGCAIGLLYKSRPHLLISIAPMLLLLGAVFLLTTIYLHPVEYADRVLLWGIPSALVVAGACSLSARAAAESRLRRLGATLGDASYSVYLIQVFTLPALCLLFKRAGVADDLPLDLVIGLAALGSIAAGVLFWMWVEKPMTLRLNQLRVRLAAR